MCSALSAFFHRKRATARRRHSDARPKVSGQSAFFPRSARPYGVERKALQTVNARERIRIEIVSSFPADAAITLRKKRGFSVCSVAGSRSRDDQSNPHFPCGIALLPALLRLWGRLPRGSVFVVTLQDGVAQGSACASPSSGRWAPRKGARMMRRRVCARKTRQGKEGRGGRELLCALARRSPPRTGKTLTGTAPSCFPQVPDGCRYGRERG